MKIEFFKDGISINAETAPEDAYLEKFSAASAVMVSPFDPNKPIGSAILGVQFSAVSQKLARKAKARPKSKPKPKADRKAPKRKAKT